MIYQQKSRNIYLVYDITQIYNLNDTFLIKAMNKLLPIKSIHSSIKLTNNLANITSNDVVIIYYQNIKYTNIILSLLENINNISIYIFVNNYNTSLIIPIDLNKNYNIISNNDFPVIGLIYSLFEYQFTSMIDKIFTPNVLLLTENTSPKILADKYTFLINNDMKYITINNQINSRKCQYLYNIFNQWIITEVFNKSKCYYTNSNHIDPLVILAIFCNDMIICNSELNKKLLNIDIISIDENSIKKLSEIEIQKSIINNNKDNIRKYCLDNSDKLTIKFDLLSKI